LPKLETYFLKIGDKSQLKKIQNMLGKNQEDIMQIDFQNQKLEKSYDEICEEFLKFDNKISEIPILQN